MTHGIFPRHLFARSQGHGPWRHGSVFGFFPKERRARRVELKINTKKTKLLSLMGHRTLTICICGQSVSGFDRKCGFC